MADENKPPNPPKLTDGTKTLREFIVRWFKSRDVPVNDKLDRLIEQVSWTGEDLNQSHRALAIDLETLGFSRIHAGGIARSITQGITRKEVRSFQELMVG